MSRRRGRPRPSSLALGGVVAGTGLLLAAPVAAQCAMCATALSSPEAAELAAALRAGILLLLAAPYLAFGMVAYLAIRGRRRAGLEPEQEP